MTLKRIFQFATKSLSKSCAIFSFALLAGSIFASSNLSAQSSPELAAMYGRGVHEYFANRTMEAERLFSEVIQAGSTDPRVYYFRAMARLRLGRQYEAEDDMRLGAAYEARDPGNRYSIGMALQRVQGPGRRMLEHFRREARLNRVKQRRRQIQLRYEQLEQRGPTVLRREVPVRLEELSGPPEQQTTPAISSDPTAPLVPGEVPQAAVDVDEPEPVVSPEKKPSSPEPPEPVPATEEGDPFAGETAADSIDDLFGEPETSAPVQATPASEGPASEGEKDSSDEASADDDLFGDFMPGANSTDAASTGAADAQPETNSDNSVASVAAQSPSEADKVEFDKLMGILGRAVGSTVPWRGIELPAIPGVSNEPAVSSAGIELGPNPTGEEETIPASAEEPFDAAIEDDLFGPATSDVSSDASEDLFGTPSDDPFEAAGGEPESEMLDAERETEEAPGEETPQQPEEDDPFGEP